MAIVLKVMVVVRRWVRMRAVPGLLGGLGFGCVGPKVGGEGVRETLSLS